jgi:4-amino-4-deoxy-L-arabinose transferase-like glycosyltransferase
MARNYYENDYNFAYPQIDWGGNTKGYVESEFPIYSFLIALLYKILGFHDYMGRIISIFFSLISVIFLYRLYKLFFDDKTSLISTAIFAILPLNIFFSRAIMPESLLIMSVILGVYFFQLWLTGQRTVNYLLSVIFISLACLIKIPTLYIGLPLLYLSWIKFGRKTFTNWKLWLYCLVVFAAVFLWYYHAHQIKINYGLSFGIWEYGEDKWGNWGLIFSFKFWNRILFQSIAEKHLTWMGAMVFIGGLFFRRSTREERVFDFWLIALIIYFIIVGRGNYVHEYYQLPFIIPASAFMGKTINFLAELSKVRGKYKIILTIASLAIISLSFGQYRIYFGKENPEKSATYKLSGTIERLTPRGSLVLAVDRNDPTLLYLSNRKGWHAHPDQLNDDFLKKRASEGAEYLAGQVDLFKTDDEEMRLRDLLSGDYEIISSDENSFIIKI